MANQIDTRELISALNEIAKEKNIDKEALFNAIKKRLKLRTNPITAKTALRVLI